MELFKSRTRVAYTNAVGDKVYPVVVDIKKGIKSTEDIQFVSSDVNTGILSVAFISGNENFNVSGADVVCSVMRPDASTLELPCEVVRENIVEVPLGINGTSQDGVYSFDFKVLKGGNKVVGTPIMNYSVSLSIGNDMVVEDDDRLPVLTMLMTQLTELKGEARESINQANAATVASREATANAIEATNNANAVSERVSQETATAISEIKQDTENAIASMNQSTSTAISTMNQSTTDAIASMNQSATDAVSNMTQKTDEALSSMNQNTANAIADMTQKTDKAVTRVNDNLANINNVVTTKVAEIDKSKTDMTTTVTNKVNEVEGRFNALTASQQQSSEVIDARDGETSLKARLDRDIEKAKEIYVDVEGSHISTDSSVGYAKDVEILGNTIQSASNLADIRSVGDKVEGQELYEIPVLSRGKNLFDKNKIVYNKWISSTTGAGLGIDTGGADTRNYLDYTKIKGGSVIKTSNITITAFYVYDKIGSCINIIYGNNSYIIPSNAEYMRMTFDNTKDFSNAQVEYETPTPYEPYIEDKLTILSPVQLEKVGNVADRIICKDGVWGVEKWQKDFANLDTLNFNLRSGANGTFKFVSANNLNYVDIPPGLSLTNQISNKYRIQNPYTEHTYSLWLFENANNKEVRFSLDGVETNIDVYKNALKDVFIKYNATTPQFIPLPHDQQVKLRTFANKTNISFGCEIEGTIKAQVPKSLGATVNTHTEQINNLNKELDRVKKLEESTVSTVTTESDFTTVEATSNGYFEDVKLEGKTLVNLCKKTSHTVIGQEANNWSKHIILTQPLVTGNKYTLIANVKTYTLDKGYSIFGRAVSIHSSDAQYGLLQITKEGIHKSVFIAQKDIVSLSIADESNSTSGESLIEDFILLEGDHTQNPPSYFEGLKSVGQSATTSEDVVDEIVVSSVNENLFNFINTPVKMGGGDSNSVITNLVKTDTGFSATSSKERYGIQYKFISKKEGYIYVKTEGNINSYISIWNSSKGTSQPCTTIATNYVKFQCKNGESFQIGIRCTATGVFSVENIHVAYSEIETNKCSLLDKKRLLYYNNETQRWEKPILRQWDSIEKHADGKYYYHQRSAEVVLNGSESSWGKSGVNHDSKDMLRFYVNANAISTPNNVIGQIVSDKFNTNSYDGMFNDNIEGIATTQDGKIGVGILKSKLPTQDVQGFKQWLQANNVTVVYQLAQEKVYECTNIDLITYNGETNYVVESGAIVPRTTLKVHNNISNVVSLLQKKVSLLESNIKASQEVQDMMILETDMRMLDIELALMEFAPMTLNLGGSDMLRSATYFNFLKNHIINETYEKEYLENVMNKYLATGRINQDEYDELYKMLYPPVYDIELPIER